MCLDYHQPFPVPPIHELTFKQELDQLEYIKVIKKINRSQLGKPTFIIPKKDITVSFISDFRELNKRILHHPYPIPRIQDLLLRLEGFRYGTTLDLNMGYYHIELSAKSKDFAQLSPNWASMSINDFQWDCATVPTSSKRRCLKYSSV